MVNEEGRNPIDLAGASNLKSTVWPLMNGGIQRIYATLQQFPHNGQLLHRIQTGTVHNYYVMYVTLFVS